MCDFCKNFDFGSASFESDKYGSRIVLSGGNYRFPVERQFNFCPRCGASRVDIMTKRELATKGLL